MMGKVLAVVAVAVLIAVGAWVNQNAQLAPVSMSIIRRRGGSMGKAAVLLLLVVSSGCIGFPSLGSPRLPWDIAQVSSKPLVECTTLERVLGFRDAEYLIMVPRVLFSGGEAAVSMAAFSEKTHMPLRRCIRFSLLSKEGVRIRLLEGSTGSTGHAHGSFRVPELEEGTYTLVAEVVGGGESFKGSVKVEKGGVLFVETDKPIYKPGQVIHGRVLALSNGLKPLSLEVVIEVTDAKGIKVFKNITRTNAFGVAAFELPLARELNLGTWKVTARSGSAKGSVDVRVEKYVLPKFRVVVDLPREWFLVDEEIRGTVAADYFFGKPVEGEVTIDAYRYVGTWEKYASFSSALAEGRGEFTLPPVGYVAGTLGAGGQGSLMLNISVTDAGGHVEKVNRLLKITRSPVVLHLIPEAGVLKPGLPFQVLVVTETPDGRPLDKEVKLIIRYDSRREEKNVTTENGVALVELAPPRDVRRAFLEAWVEGEKAASASKLLKTAYSPSSSFIHLVQVSEGKPGIGEEVVFRVYSTNNGTVYYDVVAAGRTVYSGAEEDREISVTVTPQMSLGAKIIAYMINPDNEVSADSLPFQVEASLPVELRVFFDKEEAVPGGNVSVSFDAGSLAMIGVSIVDESVYALNEGRLNLKQVFDELERRFMMPKAEAHPRGYAVRAHDVIREAGMQVLTSKGIKIPGKSMPPKRRLPLLEFLARQAAKAAVAPGYGEALPSALPEEQMQMQMQTEMQDQEREQGFAEVRRVRQFFPETWLWVPMLLTRENGEAELSLTAPDSITTWKLHAVASSREGVGLAEAELRVFQEFFLDPDLPYAVTRGEEFPVRVQVYNYLNASQSIVVELEEDDWFELLGSGRAELVVPGNSVGSVSFSIQPKAVGLHSIKVTAKSPLRADAVIKEIIVEPEGTTREVVENGVLRAGEAVDLNVSLPPGVVEDSGRVFLSIAPSIVAQTISGVDDLLRMPYGCGEQNMIFFAPNVEVLRYLKATEQLNPELRAKAEFFITTGYQRELTFQRKDGSFSAFGERDREGSLWLTAFVLSTFSGARDVYPVDEDVLARASRWIEKHQASDGSFDQVGFLVHRELMGGLRGKYALTAYVTLALLEYGEGDGEVLANAMEYLEENLHAAKEDPYSLAIAALALQKLNSSRAQEALDALLDLRKEDDNGVYWGREVRVIEPGESFHVYPGAQPSANIETTAYAALALMEAGDARANEAVKWLAAQRNSRGGFRSTQDTVLAFKALMTAAVRQGRDVDATIEVRVNGEVKELEVNPGNFDVLQVVELPGDADRVTLGMRGKGEVNYQVVKRFNVLLPETPVESDLELEVTYSAENIEVDDVVEVSVRVRYVGEAASTGMLLIDVGVPTGFVPVTSSLEELLKSGEVSRYEVAGRKIILYVDELPRGEELLLKLQVKARFPVKATIPDSTAYSYYNPEIRGEARGGEIVVNA